MIAMDMTLNSRIDNRTSPLSRGTRTLARAMVIPVALAVGTAGFTACQTTETHEPGLYQPAEPQQPGQTPPAQPQQEQPAPGGW